jgi:hypothetical protein
MIIHKSKQRPRTANITSAKPHELPSKILDFLKKSKGGITVGEYGKEIGNAPLQVTKVMKIRSQIARLEEKLKSFNVVEVPEVILPELHDAKTGRIDAQKVADFLGVPLKQLSEGLGLNYKAVHRSPSAAGFQHVLRPVKRSLELLHEFLGSAAAIRAWLNTPHPDLDGTSALETILEGKAGAVTLILENAWNGVPV